MQIKMKKVKITTRRRGETSETWVEVPDTGVEGWGDVSQMKYVGKPLQRIDGVDKVTGRAKYTYDLKFPGMLYGKILRSTYARARVVSIDAKKAAALPGVKAIILPNDEGAVDLFRRECRYAGQEVAAVAATSPEIAEDALRLIEVKYTELPFVVDVEKAMEPGAAPVHDDRGNLMEKRVTEQGDVGAGFESADVSVEATYRNEVQSHISLETHGSVANWEGDSLTVWASTQAISSVQGALARFFDIPTTNVRVLKEHLGGGFGSKLGPRPEYAICALLARKAGVPVKLMLNRKEEHLTTGNRPSAIQQAQIGAKQDGTLVAYKRYNYGTGGIIGRAGIPGQPYLYDVPNYRIEQQDVYTNAGAQTAQRAPGHPQASFAMESLMDELADKLDMDPMELRQKNDSNEVRRKMVEMGAEKIGWNRRNKTPGAGTGVKKRGIGMGSGEWGGGGGRTKAETVIHPDGSVEIKCGTQDIGTGTRTIIAQIVAEEFGLTPQEILVRIGDTNYPPSGGSGGSTTCASVSPAVKSTVLMAKLKLFDTIASQFGVTPHDMEARDGNVFVTADPSKSIPWAQATAQLGDEPLTVQGQWVPGYSSSGVPATQFAEVEVNTETGVVKVVKVVAVNDSGLVMNPLTWESQVNGGVLMGIGYALYEERIMDARVGNMVNPNLESYRLVGATEVPEIEVLSYDEPERGAIGIGEPCTIPTAGAIANAIYNACGARVRETPITPDKVLAALAAREAG